MIGVLLLFAIGLALSALFSGSETGFYRATRLRLVLDAGDGKWMARGLLALINRPAMFVAAALIGNNVANYLISLAGVLAAHRLWPAQAQWVELLAPIVVTPIVFVYGELLPKSLFYHAPNRLLRLAGPLLLFFALLFSPLIALLGGLSRLLELALGQTPLRLKAQLARKELQQVFRDGGEAGILRPAQQRLAQSLFDVASLPAMRLTTPLSRVVAVRHGAPRADALRIARRSRRSVIPVRNGDELIGYVRVVDLLLQTDEPIERVRPFAEVGHHASHLAALIELETRNADLGRVVDDQGYTLGLIDSRELAAPLLE